MATKAKTSKKNRYYLKQNKRGSLVGDDTVTGVTRTAAHLYRVPSVSTDGVTHVTYVEKLDPNKSEYRCSCMAFLANGRCHHGPLVLEFEAYIRDTFPDLYDAELHRREVARSKYAR